MIELIRKILKRNPPREEIFPVYATITFLVYGWMVIHIFWKLPSWLNFLTTGEIGIVIAYSLANALMESIVVLAVVLILSFILPSNLLRSKFILRGSILVYLSTFWVALFDITFTWFVPSAREVLSFATASILISGLLLILLRKVTFIGRFIVSFGDRLVVFLYIWLPLGITGFLVVLTRLIILNLPRG